MADVRISDLSLISAANLDGNDRLIVEQTSNGTGATKYSSLKEAMLGSSTITSLGGETVVEGGLEGGALFGAEIGLHAVESLRGEGVDLPLAVHYEPYGHRLDAAC